MLWVAILSTIHWGVQFRMLTRWWRIQFSARTVRVGSEFIRLAYLVSWSWMEDLCIHLMVKKWHGRLPFLKLYTNFKQLWSKRPLMRYGVSFVHLKSGMCSATVIVMLFIISWYIGPHNNIYITRTTRTPAYWVKTRQSQSYKFKKLPKI